MKPSAAMTRMSVLSAAIAVSVSLPALGQSYSGSFSATNDQGGQTVVQLVQSDEKVTGTMSGLGNTFQLEGTLEDGLVVGTMKQGDEAGLGFEAELDVNDLYFTLFDSSADGEPDYETAVTLVFSRVGSEPDTGFSMGSNQDAEMERAPDPEMSRPTQPGIHDGSPEAIEWANFLANKKATKMSSYSSGSSGGYSSRTDYHLCANGQFRMTDASSVSVDVGGAYGYNGGSGAGAGTWRVFSQGQVVGIELRYQSGEISQHRLDYDQQSGATYVDGERWLITPTDQCGY